jgi:hypothetical protein
MTINFEHSPYQTFQLLPCLPEVTIDMSRSVQNKLKPGEQLTNATALRILRQIKRESDVLSFFTRPIVLISLSIVGVLTATTLFLMNPILRVAGAIALVAACGVAGYTIENTFNGFLPKVSRAYSEQSRLAAEHIRTIENSTHELSFRFAPSFSIFGPSGGFRYLPFCFQE